MKQVCGTCNFQIDSRAGKGVVEIRCARDNDWRKDNSPDCGKWAEHINGLSPKDRISLVDSERKTSSDAEANRLAAEANIFAREANSSARDANRIASEAFSFTKRSRRTDRIIAITAIIIAVIAAREDIIWLISWLITK
ncbi:MAG: hypothetical protein HY742_05685 [Deltaproteobacteria bacterium]|nr:hypothetical protein [Deltaproteobacteria bacterium]